MSQVLNSVFGYIKMMQKHGPDERIYNELKIVEDINFRQVVVLKV
jgi:secreted Zn-dependent insulinase-like peptidase